MIRDSIDDFGKAFEPETPEAFFQRGEEAFEVWWRAHGVAGASRSLELDYDSARAVWSAVYEWGAGWIVLIYDGAESSADGAHATGEMELACVVDRHHNGCVALPRRDFSTWVAQHEDHIRREYLEDEHEADADTMTVWIDHSGQSPSISVPLKPPPRSSYDDLRTGADKEFAKWWGSSNPPESMAFLKLERNEARFVWREAFTQLWDDLEVVHDSATAYFDVVTENASLELAYIIDRFHKGRLSFRVSDAMQYWDGYILERERTDAAIVLRVHRSGVLP